MAEVPGIPRQKPASPKGGLISTYISNLDKELGGGIPQGHIVVLAGTPGTMKSSFAYHLLYRNAADNGARCVYLTLEENGRQLAETMRGYGYKDMSKVVMGDIGGLRDAKSGTAETIDWSKLIEKYIKKKMEGEGGILAIDSINALYTLCDMAGDRNEIFNLFRMLKTLDITTIVISEMTLDSPNYTQYEEDFLSDGIILLKLHELRDLGYQLRIVCVKMRMMPISRNWHVLDFRDGKFVLTKVIGAD